MSTPRRTAAVLLALPLLAACGGNTESTSSTVSSTTPSAAATTSTTPAAATQTSAGSSATTSTSGATACPTTATTAVPGNTALSTMTVKDVRAAAHDCYERIVVEVAGQSSTKPGYQVRYVPQVVMDGSGKPVPLKGKAFLNITIGAPAYDAAGQPTYLPADRTQVVPTTGLAAIQQVGWAGSFEGMTTFGVGLDKERPFTVQVLDDGGTVRLVVDVMTS